MLLALRDMVLFRSDTNWYRNAIVYSIDVETFRDSNGDGVGDLRGVIQSLDYLAGLGVTCLWLMPFYPSPDRDDGYDVSDYYGVEPRFGSLGDFVELVRKARERGIRILLDLVVQHTSDEHPWFRAATSEPNSPFRDYYVWSEHQPEDAAQAVLFHEQDRDKSIWTFNDTVGAYYRHRFYDFEPDLNTTNRAVRSEIAKILDFWLELGVTGFRVDAAPFMIDMTGLDVEIDDPHDYLRSLRAFLFRRSPEAVFLAEADDDMERARNFFGNGDQMQLIFNFLEASNVFLALVKHEAAPLLRAIEDGQPLPDGCAWATFLRNHDELNLQGLDEEDRQLAFSALAPDKGMRSYGRGVRRRLAPMLGGERARIELAFSILLTLPGTPVIYYGDEIGMGDNLALEERASVRTPMQWSGRPNGGFSSADSGKLVVPVINRGAYRYRSVNVEDQERDPDSLLNWMERAIRQRRLLPQIGVGAWSPIGSDRSEVLAYVLDADGDRVVVVHNLSDKPVTAKFDLKPEERRRLTALFGSDGGDLRWKGPALELGPYAYRWMRG